MSGELLLVGSIPLDTPEDVFRTFGRPLGKYLFAMPDGEVGPRRHWISRVLIRQMSVDNPLWGAPRIHGELLKLGFEVAQSSVAKYMVKRCGPPSQRWRTFRRNMIS